MSTIRLKMFFPKYNSIYDKRDHWPLGRISLEQTVTKARIITFRIFKVWSLGPANPCRRINFSPISLPLRLCRSSALFFASIFPEKQKSTIRIRQGEK